MSKIKILGIVAMSLLVGGAAYGASCDVTAAAAMGPDNGGTACGGGNCGYECTLDGNTSPAFVQDDSPQDETVYRACFRYDPSNLDPFAGSPGMIYIPIRATHQDSFKANFQIILTQKVNLNRLSIRSVTNSGAVRFSNRINASGANRYCVTSTVSDTPGVANGNVMMQVTDGPQAGQCVSTTDFSPGLNNSQVPVQNLLAGAVGNINPGISGPAYFDEFESYRTLGPDGSDCP